MFGEYNGRNEVSSKEKESEASERDDQDEDKIDNKNEDKVYYMLLFTFMVLFAGFFAAGMYLLLTPENFMKKYM